MARILVIDDDPWVLKIFRQILEDDGHVVSTASNGQEGLDLFRQNPTELIITDMVMPVKDGLKLIMELEKEFPNVPAIAISGGGVIEPERYLTLAESIGTRKTLIKPVSKQDLLDAVHSVLN
ncbi:MAG: response regulator [Proteobacteria bacterium]|nr:response regulator [Desulfobulbaceae bacterium]MBU4152477.1 response regulator [Pseudomonadota bacterium]MDP2104380.1 response regulator [Desulfobulbaceae bacterium]